jgi:hypothetical protein
MQERSGSADFTISPTLYSMVGHKYEGYTRKIINYIQINEIWKIYLSKKRRIFIFRMFTFCLCSET